MLCAAIFVDIFGGRMCDVSAVTAFAPLSAIDRLSGSDGSNGRGCNHPLIARQSMAHVQEFLSMKMLMVLAVGAVAPFLTANFPLDQWQMSQVSEMFDGLQDRNQQGTQFRLENMAWLYRDQKEDPRSLTVEQAKKLVQGCTHTGEMQLTPESIDVFMTCHGKNEGILFRFSDRTIVIGEIINPPPITFVPNTSHN
jgi:hypothetical protein